MHGVDLSAHASSLVTPDDLDWAEVVVLMDRSNWVRLRRMGFDASKLVWLGALAPGNREIPDPYSMDDDSVDELLGRMADCTGRLASALQKPVPKLD
jgi:protein-tyrosine phosphatase